MKIKLRYLKWQQITIFVQNKWEYDLVDGVCNYLSLNAAAISMVAEYYYLNLKERFEICYYHMLLN